jgi:hypothetical protein
MCKVIGTQGGRSSLPSIAENLCEVAESVKRIEAVFVEDMLHYVVGTFVPNATDWRAVAQNPVARLAAQEYLDSPESLMDLALSQVDKARLLLELPSPDPARRDRAQDLIDTLGAPLRLYHRIARKIVANGCDVSKPKHRNWVWDLQIANSVGNYTVRNGMALKLVSNDAEIVAAAAEAGFATQVELLSAYSDRLRGAVLPSTD